MSDNSPFVIARASVHRTARLSPAFVRISLRGAEVDCLGTPGSIFDQRIKVIIPGTSGRLPDLHGKEDWYAEWLSLPEELRGSMRTYTLRDVQVQGTSTTVVLDFVIHEDASGSGPGSSWARRARPGDEVLLIGPRRHCDAGGIEFRAGEESRLLLAGDETAAPAIARILEDVPRTSLGHAFIEVPSAADVLSIDAPAGVRITWLPRAGSAHGHRLSAAVLDHLQLSVSSPVHAHTEVGQVQELLWDTPQYSNTDGSDCAATFRSPESDTYFWIAGESSMVTMIRRYIVSEIGVEKHRVAFMGYWKQSVSPPGPRSAF